MSGSIEGRDKTTELQDLIQHSKTLTTWTKVIAFATFALILFTFAQIALIIVDLVK